MPRSAQAFPSVENWRIDAGRMDRRIQLLKRLQNEWGDEDLGWEVVAEVWALVQPAAGLERSASDRAVAISTVLVALRWRADVDASWRVRDGQKEYEIVAPPLDVLRKHVQLELDCREVS